MFIIATAGASAAAQPARVGRNADTVVSVLY
jgi:hypothetical protein